MEIIEFDREFVERTKWIIKNTPCKYEITLLLNCMLALIALPTERTKGGQFSSATDIKFQNGCVDKLKAMDVIKKSTSDDKTFRTVKNALSHMYIEPVNQDQKIAYIRLCDKAPGEQNYHTELEFSADQLKEFALYVAELHLERFKCAKNKIMR